MTYQTTVHIPAGDALTLTTDANTTCTYYQLNQPGVSANNPISTLSVSSSVTIGPFNTEYDYLLQSNGGQVGYSIAPDATFTSSDMSSYAPLASPVFTGAPVLPTGFKIGSVVNTTTGTELNYVHNVTSAIQTQLNAKLAAPTPATFQANIGNSATGTQIATAVNAILAALIAANLMAAS